MGEPQVKGVWFVTARRHLLEHHGETAFAAVVARMPDDDRHALIEPLVSTWYPERVFQCALEAVQQGLTFNDDARFLAFIEASTELGVNHFFRILLRIASPAYLMHRMPAAWSTHRRDNGTLVVEADEKRARLRYAGFPFFSDPNYRFFVLGVLRKVTELCTGVPPRVRVVSHGKDWLDAEVLYGTLPTLPPRA